MSTGATRHADEVHDVTVVIPVKNGAETIGQQLEALSRQSYDGNLHLVVSDNGSTDDLPGAVAPHASAFASCRIIDAGDRPGASHARNRGMASVHTEKILFCDADDEVSSTWVKAMAAGLDRGSMCGGPLVLSRINPSDVARHFSDISDPPSIYGYLPYAVGASMAVRRSAALGIGGFDLSYGAGHEEVDFAWRVQRAGGRLVWCPDAVVHYRQRAGAKRAFRQRYHYARSAILLWTRFEDTGELAPVSFRGSVRNLTRQALRSYRLISPRTRHDQAFALGWTTGTVMGHLRYRRQAPPERELMEPPTA